MLERGLERGLPVGEGVVCVADLFEDSEFVANDGQARFGVGERFFDLYGLLEERVALCERGVAEHAEQLDLDGESVLVYAQLFLYRLKRFKFELEFAFGGLQDGGFLGFEQFARCALLLEDLELALGVLNFGVGEGERGVLARAREFAFELERLFARGGEISGALGLLGGDLVLDALEFLGLACAFELDLQRGALYCERVAAEHGGCEFGEQGREFALVDGW